MERGCKKSNENIYFACRKEAALYNDKLSSREGAAELLGISSSTLANHELGVTKTMPVDTVVMMSDLYNAPQLKNLYCKNECPIGKDLPMATEINSLESVTIRLLDSLDDTDIKLLKRRLIKIAANGAVNEQEKEEFKTIVESLENLTRTMSELRMLAEKYTERSGEHEPD